MPEFFFQTHHPHAVSTIDIGGLVVNTLSGGWHGTRLRRVGADPSHHDPGGVLIASGVVTTGLVPMSGLTEVFGVALAVEWAKTGEDAASACTLQISLDGGTTYLAWTGAAWEEQDIDETYNDLETVNDHLEALDLAHPVVLGFRVLLTAVNNDTPVLMGLTAYLEWRYDPQVDLREVLFARMSAARYPF